MRRRRAASRATAGSGPPLKAAALPITKAEMIRLHKLGRVPQPFHLNPDLVVTVEASPDTVVTLTTGSRLLVTETPEEVARAVRDWRAAVLDAMTRVPRRSSSLSLVRAHRGRRRRAVDQRRGGRHEEHRP